MGTLHTQRWYYLPVIGPHGVGVSTLSTTWQTVLPANPNRMGVIFYNPGMQNMRVAPANLGTQSNAGALLVYPQNDVRLFTGMPNINVSCEWKAWVDSGANQPFTALDFIGVDLDEPMPQLQIQLTTAQQQDSPVSSGAVLDTASQRILAANPLRKGVVFMNGGTANVAVCPDNLAASMGAGSIIILPGQTKEFMGSFDARVNCGWNGIAMQVGSPLSILEFF